MAAYPDAIGTKPLPEYCPDGDSGATAAELERIRTWLTHIGESDPEIIAETPEGCWRDPQALAYFLGRSAELPAPSSVRDQAIAKLDADPSLLHAMVAEEDGDLVRIGCAIRGRGACELLVPRARYDGLDLLALWNRYTEGSARHRLAVAETFPPFSAGPSNEH